MLIGGSRPDLGGELAGGYYFEPTVLKGHNKMRVFQEEISGPLLAVTTFMDEQQALEIANDTLYALGAGVRTRAGSRAFGMGRAGKAGCVWTNCYHQYPAHAAFRGIAHTGRSGHSSITSRVYALMRSALRLLAAAAKAVNDQTTASQSRIGGASI